MYDSFITSLGARNSLRAGSSREVVFPLQHCADRFKELGNRLASDIGEHIRRVPYAYAKWSKNAMAKTEPLVVRNGTERAKLENRSVITNRKQCPRIVFSIGLRRSEDTSSKRPATGNSFKCF